MRKYGITAIVLLMIISFIIIGIIGYMERGRGNPVRVLFKTGGGNVIFTHKVHIEDYSIGCDKCHHKVEGADNKYCRACHSTKSLDSICQSRAIHKQCIGANCIDCHKEMAGRSEKECKFCHK